LSSERVEEGKKGIRRPVAAGVVPAGLTGAIARIGELADAAGLPSQTVRFYERRGLLPEPVRGANGYRIYGESTLTRLNLVRTSQAAGLTLAEIGSVIDLRDHGNVPLQACGEPDRRKARRRTYTHQRSHHPGGRTQRPHRTRPPS